jgi:hypothetical protein
MIKMEFNFCTLCNIEVGNQKESLQHFQDKHPELFYLILGHTMSDDELNKVLKNENENEKS